MARKTQVILTDDIDGTDATGTVSFAIDGVAYEIDLSAKNAEKLRNDMKKWVEAGRRVGGRRRGRSASAAKARGTIDRKEVMSSRKMHRQRSSPS
mgnify:CR=1 FL=1